MFMYYKLTNATHATDYNVQSLNKNKLQKMSGAGGFFDSHCKYHSLGKLTIHHAINCLKFLMINTILIVKFSKKVTKSQHYERITK